MKTILNNIFVILTIVFGPFMIAVMLVCLIEALASIVENL